MLRYCNFSSRHSEKPDFHKITCQQQVERFCMDNGGFVALYGETELTMDDFYKMFNDGMRHYDRLRKKYDCERAFPHVYNKISKLGRQ